MYNYYSGLLLKMVFICRSSGRQSISGQSVSPNRYINIPRIESRSARKNKKRIVFLKRKRKREKKGGAGYASSFVCERDRWIQRLVDLIAPRRVEPTAELDPTLCRAAHFRPIILYNTSPACPFLYSSIYIHLPERVKDVVSQCYRQEFYLSLSAPETEPDWFFFFFFHMRYFLRTT